MVMTTIIEIGYMTPEEKEYMQLINYEGLIDVGEMTNDNLDEESTCRFDEGIRKRELQSWNSRRNRRWKHL
jgi:hypothetical protein